MKAICVVAGDDGATLSLQDVDTPAPGPRELLVRVRAAGVNRTDLRRTQQHFDAPAGPDVAGLEMAGEVVAVGGQVSRFGIGARVTALTRAAYAEYAVVDERFAVPVPASMSWEEAAALPVWYMTAHDALVTNGGLAPGGTVLVQAATTGIGVAAVQIARHLGAARILGSSISVDRLPRVAEHGLHVGYDPRREPTEAVVERETGGRGVDIVVDMVGAGVLAENLKAAALGGRIVSVGRMGGFTDTVDLDLLALKRLSLVGVTFRTRSPAERERVLAAMLRDLGPGLADGTLRPPVDRSFPLAEALAAQEYMKQDRHFGKIVLVA